MGKDTKLSPMLETLMFICTWESLGVRLAYLLHILPFSFLHHPLSPINLGTLPLVPSSFSPSFPPSLSSLSLPTPSLSLISSLFPPLFPSLFITLLGMLFDVSGHHQENILSQLPMTRWPVCTGRHMHYHTPHTSGEGLVKHILC